ncbi:restriction endonuclease subunit S [bacterium endosymbiont of Escarpia laminata]|nr:MAG: restriction endonuclease subunit S [bacterium endosymbiont of Escarpia laminata]
MTGRYQTYHEYKDSGVEWISNIPLSWQIKKLKYLCSIQTGDKDTVNAIDDGEYPFFVRSQTVERINSYTADCEAVLTAGDGVGVGKVFHYFDGKFDYHQRVYMLNKFRLTSAKFIFYYLKSNFYKVALEGAAKSTVDSLRLPLFQNFEFSVPSLSEQHQIARFLDHETARIDQLIAKQERLIELLKEKRQAVISHAVTKGLDPDVPMKDSGVEWLGEVPEGWAIMRLALLFSESSNRASTPEELEYPILSVSIHHGISDKELNESELDRKVSRSEDKSLYKVVIGNDLAYNMMRAWQGGFGASKLNGLISPAYVVCKPKTNINTSYFELTLRSPNAVTELKRYSRGITDFRLRLYWEELRCICFPVPPVEEVDRILEYIDRANSRYDHLGDIAKKQINLLKERRTALISAAVTGKIDVRTWQPPTGIENARIPKTSTP